MVPCRIAVIVPCFNQGTFAQDAVESILKQDVDGVKVFLVDDASTDEASSAQCHALASPDVHVQLEERNRGRSTVRQFAMGLIPKCEYVLMMDCDDVLGEGYLSTLVDVLDANPRVGLAYGTLHFVNELGRPLSQTWPTRSWCRSSAYIENVIPGPGVLFRRDALSQVAGWRADFNFCSAEDMDIALQIIDAGWKAVWVERAKYLYRQHGQSFLATQNRLKQACADLAILRYHAAGIRSTIGVSAFLKRNVLAELAHSLRFLEWRSALILLKRSLLSGYFVTILMQLIQHCFRSRAEE